MDIGFIGLGQMGAGIARNLLRAGHRLTVWNRGREKAEALVAEGAVRANSPAEAAGGEVVMTMLADDAAVEAVTFGANGILAGEGRPIHVSLSTISPALAARLADAHGADRFVSAPVFGRPEAAAAAKLFVVAAAPEGALGACRPLFEAIGQRTFAVGPEPAAANLVKLCGNFLIMAAVESMGEAIALARAGGVDGQTLLDILTGTLFDAPIYRNYGALIVGERYRPAGFAAPLGLKDMTLAQGAASGHGVPMPVLSVVRDRLLATIAREGADIDWSGIARIAAADAGL